MRQMMEFQKNGETTELEPRVDAMETDGLTYTQHGREITGQNHFNLDPLKTAYNEYISEYDNWESSKYDGAGEAKVIAAWMKVGLAQRDLPVHIVNEYFRKEDDV